MDGRIYKIVDVANGKCYVGSTCSSLSKRFWYHRHENKSLTGASLYFKEVGWDRARIELVEEFPCENVQQLRAREEHWRVELVAELNMRRAHVALPEGTPRRCEDPKGYGAAYRKVHIDEARYYREANRAILNARKRERVPCPHCGKELSRDGMARHFRRKHCDIKNSTMNS